MTRNIVDSFYQPRQELLLVAESVAREKDIDKEEVLTAMEEAVQRSVKHRYGLDRDIHVHIDRKTGVLTIVRRMIVVENVEQPAVELSLEEAQIKNPSAKLGDTIEEQLPSVELGRVAARNSRQIILQRIREAERAHQYAEYKEREGQIISGLVKRIEFGNVIVDLGRAEALLTRDEMIPRETFHTGDRIRCYISAVRPDAKGHMVLLSRAHPQFMARLFEQEVPEIYEGVIEIKNVVRDCGSRAKMAVNCNDPSLDPIGACVGLRGTRVQAIVTELRGEKVDIVPWSANPATFVVNALAPAEVTKVVLDEERQRVEVVVPENQLSLAIGRRGQNVRLASQLTGWDIDIMTESESNARRAEEQDALTKLFVGALNIDELMAQLLIVEGFTDLEEIAEVPFEELSHLEGFDEELALELKKRALLFLNQKKEAFFKGLKQKGVKEDLIGFIETWPQEWVEKLLKQNIKCLSDLADLAGDELLEIVNDASLTLDDANEIIMAAREESFGPMDN